MEIRDYKLGDEKYILDLFEKVFKKKLSESFWRWRFANNPENIMMIKLMWDGDQLAGHYALSPLQMIVGDKVILTALSMTTMTHPNYGGQGIFGTLAEALYNEQLQKNKLFSVWGFPNSNSHYGFIKNLQWENLEQIPFFSVSAEKIKDISGNIEWIRTFESSHENAYKKTTSDYVVKVNKTKKFLNWRYVDNPIFNYHIFSLKESEDCSWFVVTKSFPSPTKPGFIDIDLVEICLPPDLTIINQILGTIKTYYSKESIDKFNCWLPLNDKKHLLFEKAGFIPTSPVTYLGVRVMEKTAEPMADNSHWFYSLGDSDVY